MCVKFYRHFRLHVNKHTFTLIAICCCIVSLIKDILNFATSVTLNPLLVVVTFGIFYELFNEGLERRFYKINLLSRE